ncbi:alpha/beta fold hydrolase [Ramlibacter albus]|uniref:Alpha/beta fold hydrolase n=1 Tax=Ramlibacter albus TaxID=2079448 RepID=A0A923MEA5_9BURK|nr:alpha/beta fold hydrolase [Ramlibacter albus]MBC5767714.1 alpha/beta fold hydrolase [Ramlibacter albus]
MTAFRQQIRFATASDGVKIAYATSGDGPPLVRAGHWMTHLEWDWRTPVWGPWIERLSARHRLVRYDSRGCGLSDGEVEGVGLDALVADLEAAVDAAGLEQFALLGVSQGGAVAIAYAARHPQRVSRLVLLDAFARGALVRRPGDEELLDAMARLVLAGWGQDNAAFRQMFTSQFFPRATPAQAEAFNDLQRVSCTPAHAHRLMRSFARLDASALLPAVRCPTLVLHCRGDVRVPFEEGRFVASGIADASFQPLESANHVPLQGESAFDEAVQRIEEFLGVAAAGGGAFAALSPREREVVELLARGLDNAQIGAHLGLAEKTVRNNVSLLFDKLGAENRAQAIVRAREAGYGRGAAGG